MSPMQRDVTCQRLDMVQEPFSLSNIRVRQHVAAATRVIFNGSHFWCPLKLQGRPLSSLRPTSLCNVAI